MNRERGRPRKGEEPTTRPHRELRHGNIRMYVEKGCRCERCSEAWVEYVREEEFKKEAAKAVEEKTFPVMEAGDGEESSLWNSVRRKFIP